jgi:hypothetical protein
MALLETGSQLELSPATGVEPPTTTTATVTATATATATVAAFDCDSGTHCQSDTKSSATTIVSTPTIPNHEQHRTCVLCTYICEDTHRVTCELCGTTLPYIAKVAPSVALLHNSKQCSLVRFLISHSVHVGTILLAYLKISDVFSLELTCRSLRRQFTCHVGFWKQMMVSQFGVSPVARIRQRRGKGANRKIRKKLARLQTVEGWVQLYKEEVHRVNVARARKVCAVYIISDQNSYSKTDTRALWHMFMECSDVHVTIKAKAHDPNMFSIIMRGPIFENGFQNVTVPRSTLWRVARERIGYSLDELRFG